MLRNLERLDKQVMGASWIRIVIVPGRGCVVPCVGREPIPHRFQIRPVGFQVQILLIALSLYRNEFHATRASMSGSFVIRPGALLLLAPRCQDAEVVEA